MIVYEEWLGISAAVVVAERQAEGIYKHSTLVSHVPIRSIKRVPNIPSPQTVPVVHCKAFHQSEYALCVTKRRANSRMAVLSYD